MKTLFTIGPNTLAAQNIRELSTTSHPSLLIRTRRSPDPKRGASKYHGYLPSTGATVGPTDLETLESDTPRTLGQIAEISPNRILQAKASPKITLPGDRVSAQKLH